MSRHDELRFRSIALILIDLQRGIVAGEHGPYRADAVVAKGKNLAACFRAGGAPVVLVHVGFTPETMPTSTCTSAAEG